MLECWQDEWKKTTPRCVLMGLEDTKYEEKILKTPREEKSKSYEGVISETSDCINPAGHYKIVEEFFPRSRGHYFPIGILHPVEP